MILCLSADLFAREINLATITGNVDTDTSYFMVEITEAGLLDTVRFRTVTKEGRVSQDSHFPVQTVDATGVLLLERNNRDILRLETIKPFSFETGGLVKLSFLYSGVTNSWKSLKIQIVKVGEDFEIRTLKGEKVTRFFTKGNWHPILGLIGIADLVPLTK
jgi:hypothetical protein